ncbi:MAG: DUF202 domain-containing protein [Thermaerobacter sp.]|nr:DUF202 domain-containing protein [Thermaerobacter sp.]
MKEADALIDRPDPRTILANERTFLAWLRTGVSLMAFGFVVSKFSLFVHLHRVRTGGLHAFLNNTDLGLAWVASGIIVTCIASIHYLRTRQHIYIGADLPKSHLPLSIAILLGLLGVVIFVYLLAFP